MQKYQNNVISPVGQALANVSVLVNTYPNGIKAVIYSDNGVTQAPNPLTTDANGAFSFYAEDGHYSIVISGPSIQTVSMTDIVLADVIPSDNAPASSVGATDVITVQQGAGLRSATMALVRNGIINSGQPVDVPSGGTGVSSLTAHALVVGNGTNPVNQPTLGTAGQPLVSGGAGMDPAFGSTLGPMTFSGLITPSSTAGVKGTSTNDNANAGSVGEFVSTSNSGTALSNNVPSNATSFSLGAGDWDVQGVALFSPGASTSVAAVTASVSNASATISPLFSQTSQVQGSLATGANQIISTPVVRMSLASATNVYIAVQAAFGGTMSVNGFIRARRVR